MRSFAQVLCRHSSELLSLNRIIGDSKSSNSVLHDYFMFNVSAHREQLR